MSEEKQPSPKISEFNFGGYMQNQMNPDFEVGAFLKEWLKDQVKSGNLPEMPNVIGSHPYSDPTEKKGLTIAQDDLQKLDDMLRDGNIDSGDGHLVHFTSNDESMLLRLTEILEQNSIVSYRLNHVFDGENKQEISVLFLPETSVLLNMAKERWKEKHAATRTNLI
jgi:hypothetical protein